MSESKKREAVSKAASEVMGELTAARARAARAEVAHSKCEAELQVAFDEAIAKADAELEQARERRRKTEADAKRTHDEGMQRSRAERGTARAEVRRLEKRYREVRGALLRAFPALDSHRRSLANGSVVWAEQTLREMPEADLAKRLGVRP